MGNKSKTTILLLVCCAVLMAAVRPAAAQTSQPGSSEKPKTPERLTLKQAIAVAKKQNLKLRSSRQGLSAATEGKRSAWGLLGPHLWASAGLSFAGGDSAFGNSGDSSSLGDVSTLCSNPATAGACKKWMAENGAYTSQLIGQAMSGMSDMGQIMNSDSFKVTLGATWSLFNAKNLINVQRAGLSTRSSRAALADTTQDVVTSVTLSFYNVLAADEGLSIARQTLATTAAHLAQARSRREAGSATRTDVLRWQARHAADRQGVVTTGQQAATARVQLNNLLGRPLTAPLTLEAPTQASTRSLPRPARKRQLSGSHPQLKLAQLAVDSRNLDRKNAGAAFLPSLNLNVGYSWQRYLPHEEIASSTGWLGSWSAGLTLQIPIFDSATKVFEVRRSSRELSRARLDQDNTRRALQQRLIQADLTVQASYQNMAVAREQLTSADAAHRSATDLYGAGSATTTDVLDAQKSLAAARYNLRNARYSYLAALAQRDRAAGTKR